MQNLKSYILRKMGTDPSVLSKFGFDVILFIII